MRYAIIVLLLLGVMRSVDAQNSISPYQKSVLDFWYAKADTNSIDGSWIIVGTVSLDKLSTNLQTTILLPYQIEEVSSSTTLDVLKRTILINTIVNDVNITLPPSSTSMGLVYELKFSIGSNACNIIPDGLETIDGDIGPFVLYLDESLTIKSDGGSNWVIL